MLSSFEQACNPLDAIYFNKVTVLGILTLESRFRLKTLGIYLMQIALVHPCGTSSALTILCYYSNAFFLFFDTFFLLVNLADPS